MDAKPRFRKVFSNREMTDLEYVKYCNEDLTVPSITSRKFREAFEEAVERLERAARLLDKDAPEGK